MRKRKVFRVIPAHDSLISTVKYQPQYGNYLATASFDGKIKLWSAKNWSVMKTLTGHEDKISCLDISPVKAAHVKMEIEGEDESFAGYTAPTQMASTSFDRNWNLWGPDVLSEL